VNTNAVRDRMRKELDQRTDLQGRQASQTTDCAIQYCWSRDVLMPDHLLYLCSLAGGTPYEQLALCQSLHAK